MTDPDGLATTNAALKAMQEIAIAMGLELDELGHPYRRAWSRDAATFEPYLGTVDFDPMLDPADAFRVQVHFNLSVEVAKHSVIVRAGMGPLLAIHEIHDSTFDGRVLSTCEAVCKAAVIHLARERMREQQRVSQDMLDAD